MQLVIVESPTKSKTLQRFLGPKYRVLSSYGHIRDLPKGEFGVDVEHDFQPKYVIPTKAKKTINLLKKESQAAESTILATDEDREGEAISYHLKEALGLKNPQRIVFHEITKSAIEQALKNPRDIDMSLVNSQQARRILDRIVGYKLSPFLWKKVARGLSAGRVQSVAVRLVAEREREIQGFIPQEYWSIEALLEKNKNEKRKTENGNEKLKTEFLAQLVKKNGQVLDKFSLKNKKTADDIVKDLDGAEYKVANADKKELKKNPLPPFTTSTLQQEAWKKFRFPAKLTMRVAQNLYERGLITYHRTDSLNIADQALFSAKKFIEAEYGKKYWAGFPRKYKTKIKGAQEAHEAIRPAYPDRAPPSFAEATKGKDKTRLERNQMRLYDLIWRRFIACQMSQAVFYTTTVDVTAKPRTKTSSAQNRNYGFRANGQMLQFDGFLKIYPIKFEESELPQLEKDELLELLKLVPSQHFTQPPARYTEASLIKTLEENGIGRPSTYAPIISTIQERNYIEKDEQKRFLPTEIGTVVNDLLVEHFPKVVDIKFTAGMEENLDEIARGEKQWVPVLKEFYDPFAQLLETKYGTVSKKDIAESPTEKTCPKCFSPLIIKLGKFGKFYACSGFPKCRYTESLEKNVLGIKCPKCSEGNIVEKRTQKRKIFYGCNRYPECDFALWDKPVRAIRPSSVEVQAHGEPTGEKCPKCGSLLVETKTTRKIKCSNKECGS